MSLARGQTMRASRLQGLAPGSVRTALESLCDYVVTRTG